MYKSIVILALVVMTSATVNVKLIENINIIETEIKKCASFTEYKEITTITFVEDITKEINKMGSTISEWNMTPFIIEEYKTLQNIYNKLQTIMKPNRTKRGILNGVGTINKWLWGNMDEDDKEQINAEIKSLQQTNAHIRDEEKTVLELSKTLLPVIHNMENIKSNIEAEIRLTTNIIRLREFTKDVMDTIINNKLPIQENIEKYETTIRNIGNGTYWFGDIHLFKHYTIIKENTHIIYKSYIPKITNKDCRMIKQTPYISKNYTTAISERTIYKNTSTEKEIKGKEIIQTEEYDIIHNPKEIKQNEIKHIKTTSKITSINKLTDNEILLQTTENGDTLRITCPPKTTYRYPNIHHAIIDIQNEACEIEWMNKTTYITNKIFQSSKINHIKKNTTQHKVEELYHINENDIEEKINKELDKISQNELLEEKTTKERQTSWIWYASIIGGTTLTTTIIITYICCKIQPKKTTIEMIPLATAPPKPEEAKYTCPKCKDNFPMNVYSDHVKYC